LVLLLQQLDDETLAHIDAENRRQTLEEEIEFLKSIHDQVFSSNNQVFLSSKQFDFLHFPALCHG
jgi:hypothetical protein